MKAAPGISFCVEAPPSDVELYSEGPVTFTTAFVELPLQEPAGTVTINSTVFRGPFLAGGSFVREADRLPSLDCTVIVYAPVLSSSSISPSTCLVIP